jgi:hypothetical protein
MLHRQATFNVKNSLTMAKGAQAWAQVFFVVFFLPTIVELLSVSKVVWGWLQQFEIGFGFFLDPNLSLGSFFNY